MKAKTATAHRLPAFPGTLPGACRSRARGRGCTLAPVPSPPSLLHTLRAIPGRFR